MTQLSWFVYVLKSSTRAWFYVGFTSDLARRMREHDAGCVQSTKARRPLILVAYIALPTERKARELEKYFKTGSGKAILMKRILTDEAP
jgi:predicted GIY-YIG superfamily endonuclease